MHRTLLTFALAGLTTAALGAVEQPTFDGLDSNGDSAVSYAEFQVQWPNTTWHTFRKADANRDGHLDAAEISDFEAMLNRTFRSTEPDSGAQ